MLISLLRPGCKWQFVRGSMAEASRLFLAASGTLGLLFVMFGCAATGGRSSSTPFPTQTGDVVTVISPSVQFIDANTGNPAQLPAQRADEVSQQMTRALTAQLAVKGVATRVASTPPMSGQSLTGSLTIVQGPGAFWDPNSGAIASGSTRLSIDLRLGDRSGGVEWQQSAMLRCGLSSNGHELEQLARLALGQ
jgi:hypothetical protein